MSTHEDTDILLPVPDGTMAETNASTTTPKAATDDQTATATDAKMLDSEVKPIQCRRCGPIGKMDPYVRAKMYGKLSGELKTGVRLLKMKLKTMERQVENAEKLKTMEQQMEVADKLKTEDIDDMLMKWSSKTKQNINVVCIGEQQMLQGKLSWHLFSLFFFFDYSRLNVNSYSGNADCFES